MLLIHGSQFRDGLRRAVYDLGIKHVRCSVGNWQLNAKLERTNRTLKDWASGAMLLPSTNGVQSRVDVFVEWFNERRPLRQTIATTDTRFRASQKRDARSTHGHAFNPAAGPLFVPTQRTYQEAGLGAISYSAICAWHY